MEFKYILTESEMISAMRLHGQGNKRIRMTLVTLGFFLLILAVIISPATYPIIILSGAILGYLTVYLWIIPYQAKKQYRELKSIQSEIQIKIDNNGFKIESTTGKSELDWGHFKKWAYNKNIIIMYITSRMFYILPRRAIDNEEQLNNILTILNNNIGKNI